MYLLIELNLPKSQRYYAIPGRPLSQTASKLCRSYDTIRKERIGLQKIKVLKILNIAVGR